ncbi:hypothetical protein GQR58_013978 [Nymphon striatum]|nr:hypothetical protein GQR58_013978 [Nymphon striatum]
MHAFMENFAVLGKFVEGSGFEEIVFQSGEAQTGTIRGILSGKHYNRAWSTHEAFAEAIDRFFMTTYMSPEIREITEFISRLPDQRDIRHALLQSRLLDEVHKKYLSLKTECMSGVMGLDVKILDDTFMRSAKTTGSMRNISHLPDTYEKWVRNRPYAAQMVEALYQLADMDDSTNSRKCLRPSQIEKSEKTVRGIMETIRFPHVIPLTEKYNTAFSTPETVRKTAIFLEDGLNTLIIIPAPNNPTTEDMIHFGLKGEIEVLITAAQDQALNTRYYKRHFMKEGGTKSDLFDPRDFRLCGNIPMRIPIIKHWIPITINPIHQAPTHLRSSSSNPGSTEN